MLTHHRSTDSRPARSVLATASVLLAVVSGASACGSSSDTPSGDTSTDPKVVDVTFTGDSVSPNGERLDVAVGQEIDLKVTADKPGEIHVHTDPEQELAYDEGTSTVVIKPISQPGIIEVESHSLDRVILQLEVR